MKQKDFANLLEMNHQNYSKMEHIYLDRIIGMFTWTNEHMWKVADFLYYDHLGKWLQSRIFRAYNRFFLV